MRSLNAAIARRLEEAADLLEQQGAVRSHRLGRTHDWVVIYVDHDGGDHQATVITAERGPRRGERIVAGRDLQGDRTAAPSIEEMLRWHSTY